MCMARPVKSVKPDKPFNDGYKYVDDSRRRYKRMGRMSERALRDYAFKVLKSEYGEREEKALLFRLNIQMHN